MNNQKPLRWTEHARYKMRQYGLSETRVKRVLAHPVRTEAGIAPSTVALMQNTTTKRPQEIWIMYQDSKIERTIIAAWRYPGVSHPRDPAPFPDDLMKK